jgi:hypothetical protein
MMRGSTCGGNAIHYHGGENKWENKQKENMDLAAIRRLKSAAMSDLRPNVFALQLIDQKVAKWILNIVIVVIIVQHT